MRSACAYSARLRREQMCGPGPLERVLTARERMLAGQAAQVRVGGHQRDGLEAGAPRRAKLRQGLAVECDQMIGRRAAARRRRRRTRRRVRAGAPHGTWASPVLDDLAANEFPACSAGTSLPACLRRPDGGGRTVAGATAEADRLAPAAIRRVRVHGIHDLLQMATEAAGTERSGTGDDDSPSGGHPRSLGPHGSLSPAGAKRRLGHPSLSQGGHIPTAPRDRGPGTRSTPRPPL